MESDYVSVNEVKNLYNQLHSWNKEEFLYQIGVGRYLNTGEIRGIVNRTIV